MAFVKSIPTEEESVAAVMRRYPVQAMPMMQLSEQLLRTGECDFTHEERELIGAYASGVNNCTYCYNTHKATAEAFGIEEGLLDSMVNDLETAAVDEKMRPVLRYVRKLTETPSKMVQADADAIFDAGWDENCFHYGRSGQDLQGEPADDHSLFRFGAVEGISRARESLSSYSAGPTVRLHEG